MTLTELMNTSNDFTDENISIAMALSFVNAGIDVINMECGIKLPVFKDATTDYLALDRSWISGILGNYLSYAIKMNDSSRDEALVYKDEFLNALTLFKNSPTGLATVSDEYKEDYSGGIYKMDTSNAIDQGWFGPGADRGTF